MVRTATGNNKRTTFHLPWDAAMLHARAAQPFCSTRLALPYHIVWALVCLHAATTTSGVPFTTTSSYHSPAFLVLPYCCLCPTYRYHILTTCTFPYLCFTLPTGPHLTHSPTPTSTLLQISCHLPCTPHCHYLTSYTCHTIPHYHYLLTHTTHTYTLDSFFSGTRSARATGNNTDVVGLRLPLPPFLHLSFHTRCLCVFLYAVLASRFRGNCRRLPAPHCHHQHLRHHHLMPLARCALCLPHIPLPPFCTY